MEILVHGVVEQILERLPPKSLVRFKSVSKRWKSTIESPFFQHKHMIRYLRKSKTPNILMINTIPKFNPRTPYNFDHHILKFIITLELDSFIPRSIPIPWEFNPYILCQNSIDCLICLYNDYDSIVILNPASRWYRTLPPSTFQQEKSSKEFSTFGFGKDEITGLYKPVWLYNSDNMTTKCEVSDFNINAWRFIEPSSPLKLPHPSKPVYLTGSMCWLTVENEEEIRSIISLNLHTEIFEIVCEAPDTIPLTNMVCYNMGYNLCVVGDSEYGEVIWCWYPDKKTWETLCNTELSKSCPNLPDCLCEIWPLDITVKNNRLIMLYNYSCCSLSNQNMRLMISDDDGNETTSTSSHEVCPHFFNDSVCYFPSLISIL